MALKYKDFAFYKGEYGTAKEYADEDAIVLAIRNILLSKPGNFPFNPSIGINIKQYQFEILDDQTLNEIESKIKNAITKYIPDIMGIEVYLRKIEDENGKPYLGLAIFSNVNGTDIESNFILSQDGDTVSIFNEIR